MCVSIASVLAVYGSSSPVCNSIHHICNTYNLNKYALFTDSFHVLGVDLVVNNISRAWHVRPNVGWANLSWYFQSWEMFIYPQW